MNSFNTAAYLKAFVLAKDGRFYANEGASLVEGMDSEAVVPNVYFTKMEKINE